ncbi:MAG TPA: hypothetical protein ENN25_01900 [Euryarchaeota archaeon]|nr:hypothetical protein [Euryarchaeota archaeon]
MSRYGLVLCPFCATPLAADLRKKSMTCVCGKSIDLLRLKPRFTSDSPSEVAEAVAQAKVQTTEGKMMKPSMSKPRSRIGRMALRAREIKDTRERLTYIALELTRLKGEFGVEELAKVHELLGKETPSDMLVMMRENGIVFESGKGKYRSV